jgi:ABC-type amino acid transport substrate-binding protein
MTKKKWFRNVCLGMGLLMAASFGAGCSRKSSGENDSLAEIRSAGTIKIALYSIGEKDTDADGNRIYDLKLADYIAKAIGVSAEYTEFADLDEISKKLESGEVSLALGRIPDYGSYGENITATSPYASEKLYMVTRRGDYSDSTAAFTGRTVGITAKIPDEGFQWLLEHEDVNTGRIGISDVVRALDSGSIDGYLCTKEEADELAAETDHVQVQSFTGEDPLSYVMLVKSGGDRLLSGINTIISQGLPTEE